MTDKQTADDQFRDAAKTTADDPEKGVSTTDTPAEDEVTSDHPTDQGESAATDTPDDEQTDEGKAGREAAKYRRQLREAEAERDTLKATVEALQRKMVEDAAQSQVSKPAALWAAGIELAALLGDDGLPDAEKIRAACKDAADRLGLSRPPVAPYVPEEGTQSSPVHAGQSFTEAFGPQRH